MVMRWLRSASNFYGLIGQNLTGEFMRKIYASSGNLFTDSWSWELCVILWCFYLSVSTGCTEWNTATFKILLLFMAGLFIGFLVEKCAACQSDWKSDFGLHRVHLAWCVRPSKKKAFLVPARFISWSRLCFLFVSSNVCTNKNQKALLLLCSQFSSIDYKKKL